MNGCFPIYYNLTSIFEKFPVRVYRVQVYTGHGRNSGTEARVHLMINGQRGDTGKRALRQPLTTDVSSFSAGNVSSRLILFAQNFL